MKKSIIPALMMSLSGLLMAEEGVNWHHLNQISNNINSKDVDADIAKQRVQSQLKRVNQINQEIKYEESNLEAMKKKALGLHARLKEGNSINDSTFLSYFRQYDSQKRLSVRKLKRLKFSFAKEKKQLSKLENENKQFSNIDELLNGKKTESLGFASFRSARAHIIFAQEMEAMAKDELEDLLKNDTLSSENLTFKPFEKDDFFAEGKTNE